MIRFSKTAFATCVAVTAAVFITPSVRSAEAVVAVCASRAGCWESAELAVGVSSLNSSRQNGRYFVASMLRFTNKTDRPLALAYVYNSPLLTDNRGNRYDLQGVPRGLPQFNQSQTKVDFVLPPGASRDAGIEFQTWLGDRNIAGDQYALALAVRELKPSNVEVGTEHAVSLSGLIMGMGGTAAPVSDVPAAAVMPAPRPVPSGCAAASACFSEGALQVLATQIRTLRNEEATEGDEQHAAVFLQLSNRGDKPLVLAYRMGSAQLIDSNGNRYARHGASDEGQITGLAIATPGNVATHFVLEPGATRTVALRHHLAQAATLNLSRRFNYDLELLELQPQAGGKVTLQREYLVTLRNIDSQALAPKPRPKSGFETYKDEQAKELRQFRESSGF